MERIKRLKPKKILALVIGVVLVAGIVSLIFYWQKLPTYTLFIEPTELSPFVSKEQARETICTQMEGSFFDEVCQQKFDQVGKGDAEKIGALFSLTKKIESDRRISDYDRLLLAQAVFASLPTKDSPLVIGSNLSDVLARLTSLIIENNVARAQAPVDELANTIEEFKKQMMADLQIVVDTNLPGQDNAWVLNVAISKYAWVNGERQPLYSEEYVESFDPYSDIITTTGEELENKGNHERYLLTHVRSRTSAYASSEEMYTGPLKEGRGEMIVYSFSMASWESKPYGADSVLVLAEAGPGERYDSARHTYTEETYKGDDQMTELFDIVKMPSREGRTVNQQEKTEAKRTIPPYGTPISKSDWGDIADELGCSMWMVAPETGLYCYTEEESNAQLRDIESGKDLSSLHMQPPTYPFYDGNQPWQAFEESSAESYEPDNSDEYPDAQEEVPTTQPVDDDCQRAPDGTCLPSILWTESR